MKIYLAGKITGDPDYREKFRKVETDLTKQGFVVMSPATLPEHMTPADYMRICFAMIDSADTVVLLPGWSNSEGATLEWIYCRYIGKDCMDLQKLMEYTGEQPIAAQAF